MTNIQKDISITLTRYNFLIKVLEKIIDAIELSNKNNNHWYIFSEKIGRKYLNQSYTFQNIIKEDTYFLSNESKVLFIDFSSLFILQRAQLETYSVFYHLFADNCEMEEKIIRFRLWELDGLRTIENYERLETSELTSKLIDNKNSINECIRVIQSFKYFNNLTNEKQKFLIERANWKFTSESLMNKDKRKWKLSINEMILNTGMKVSLFKDSYSFSSTHAHTSYWSVTQNNSLTEEELFIMKYTVMMENVFITSFLIKDFCRIYNPAQIVFDSLSNHEKEVINSFHIAGRK